jgi:hypothetical protein
MRSAPRWTASAERNTQPSKTRKNTHTPALSFFTNSALEPFLTPQAEQSNRQKPTCDPSGTSGKEKKPRADYRRKPALSLPALTRRVVPLRQNTQKHNQINNTRRLYSRSAKWCATSEGGCAVTHEAFIRARGRRHLETEPAVRRAVRLRSPHSPRLVTVCVSHHPAGPVTPNWAHLSDRSQSFIEATGVVPQPGSCALL